MTQRAAYAPWLMRTEFHVRGRSYVGVRFREGPTEIYQVEEDGLESFVGYAPQAIVAITRPTTKPTRGTVSDPEKISIKMSERAPVKIDPQQWPVLVERDLHDGVLPGGQPAALLARRIWTIRIREHADGRRLVYGWVVAGPAGAPEGFRAAEGGFLVEPSGDTARAVKRVEGIIGHPGLALQVLEALPAEEL